MLDVLLGAGQVFAKRQCWPSLDEYNALLDPPIHGAGGARIRFVAQGRKATRMEDGYEARIYLTGEVQTRAENWHDFFNALVWLSFPLAKSALNARHFAAISLDPDNPARGRQRDALTLFDESGVAVVCANDDLAELLREHRWKELFWERREEVRNQMKFFVFGHSLHEKALQPYIGFTGKGLLLKVDADFLARSGQEQLLDGMIARRFIGDTPPTTRDFTPIPLLGVPGWWPGNEDAAFYDNTAYFRARRMASSDKVTA